jgi:hypothetical protein
MIAGLVAFLSFQEQVIAPKDVWETAKPGSWVRTKITTTEGDKKQIDWEDRTLESSDADSVTLRSDYFIGGAETTRTDKMPKLKSELLTFVGEEEIEVDGKKYPCVVQEVKAANLKDWMPKEAPWRGWASLKQTMVDGPMTRTLTVKKLSKEKIKVRDQEFDCIVIVSEIESAWADQKRVEVFRQWVSEAMPGSVVRLETESPGMEGKTVFRTLETIDWGEAAKPSFALPVANERMRDINAKMRNLPSDEASRAVLRTQIRETRDGYEKAFAEPVHKDRADKLKRLVQKLEEWENSLK